LPKVQKEPYLTYEELMDGIEDKTLHAQPTGMAVPVQKGYVTNVKPTPYEEIDGKLDWSEESKAQKKSEVKAIQESARVREKEINREHLLEQAKNYGGAALELGSAFVPGYGGAKVAGTLAKKLAPTVGRKIAKEIATGTLKGASSGTVEGLGRGLLEDENLLKTAIQDTIVGTTLGAGLGMAGANVEKFVRGNKLRKIDSIECLNQAQIKNLRKDATNYYDDYIKVTTVKRKDMDDIYFGNAGIGELRSKSLHNVGILPDLKKQIQTGTKKSSQYDYDREDISGFDIIENSKKGKTYEYQIANDKANGNKFYMVKDTTKTDPYLTNWDQHPGSGKSPTNIISSSQNNLNPTTSGTQPNKQIPTLESEEEWLKRLRRQRQRRGFF
jgi:hypothetical protein